MSCAHEPAATEARFDAETIGSATALPARRQSKVLCIDDDADITRIIKMRLERFGIDVWRTFSGMQGYWTALDIRPDVIVSDLLMPDGKGDYTYGRVKANSLTKDIPFIVLTGQTDNGVKRKVLSLGVQAYLTKPLVFKDLLCELGRYIDLPTAASAVIQSSPVLNHSH
jgi:DNA-binding response OmpR family regulator